MGTLYLGSYLWPLTPPLQCYQRGEGEVAIFLPSEGTESACWQLLEKICASVGLSLSQAEVWQVHAPLTLERLRLFAEPILWVFGAAVEGASRGIYTLTPFRPVPKSPSSRPKEQTLFVLPALSEMLLHSEAKKYTWQCIRGLASSS